MRFGDLGGIHVAATAPRVNHLLFADDCLLFCRALAREAARLKDIVDKYCFASGHRVNNEKSSIYFGKKVPGQKKLKIKAILNVQSESLNVKY
jgi:hypothetical protein